MKITPALAWDGIRKILEEIPEESIRTAYLAFHDKYRELALVTPGSVRTHHAWPGGYAVHIYEVMTNIRTTGPLLRLPKPPGFTKTDSICASYIHDGDKLVYRYELDDEPPSWAQTKLAGELGLQWAEGTSKSALSDMIDASKKGAPLDPARVRRHRYREDALDFDDSAIVMKICHDHGLELSHVALHAICLHHGGWAYLARGDNKARPTCLAVLLHAADLLSARVQLGDVDWLPDPEKPEPLVSSLYEENGRYAKSEVVNHGVDCPKVEHGDRVGFLHHEGDDGPYLVDGVAYCGRCHTVMPKTPLPPKQLELPVGKAKMDAFLAEADPLAPPQPIPAPGRPAPPRRPAPPPRKP